MPRIPTYQEQSAQQIRDSNVLLGEAIGSTDITSIYTFAELKKYFGVNGGTGVTAIIDKNGGFHTGNVEIVTGDIFETVDFNFVSDLELSTLNRFVINGENMNLWDADEHIITFIGRDLTNEVGIDMINPLRFDIQVPNTVLSGLATVTLQDTYEDALTYIAANKSYLRFDTLNDRVEMLQNVELIGSTQEGDASMQALVLDPTTKEIKKFTIEGNSYIDVNQTGLGLAVVVGDVISLVNNTYVLANATDSTKVAIGIVVEIIDDDNIRYQENGLYTSDTVPAIKFISANKEYISSPEQQYLPDTFDEIDLEVEFSGRDIGSALIFIEQRDGTTDFNKSFEFWLTATTFLDLNISDGINNTTIQVAGFENVTEGNIKVKGNSGNLDTYLDDVLVSSDLVTITQDSSNYAGELLFNALDFGFTKLLQNNGIISYIKIQEHIWTFSEGIGSTTTNSQGVVSTLHSDVSTEAMWIQAAYTKGSNYYLAATDGAVTTTEPNNYKQSLFQAIENNQILINIEPMFVVGSGGGSGTTIIAVNQIGIGLLVSLDQPISLVGGSYVLANATDSTKVAIGIVTNIIDDDNIEYQDSGEYETDGVYTQGTVYYLGATDGAVAPSEPDNYKQVLFTAIESGKALIDVGNMYVVTDGGGGTAEIVIAVNQIGLGSLSSLDNAIALNGANYELANATDSTKVAVGIVTKIVDNDNIEFKDTGTYDTAGTYTKGAAYYLGTTDGNSIATEPNNYKQPIFNAIETNKMLINIHPMFVLDGAGGVETDPIFTASDAFGIDATDISNWDTAFNWGDHAIEASNGGYIIKGRDEDNYGGVGLKAIDLSYSSGASTTRGATGDYSYAEGYNVIASGIYSHAEGKDTTASGESSHVEGEGSKAVGEKSHAEGEYSETTVLGVGAHAEGAGIANAYLAHAEGSYTQANGDYSHSEGVDTIADGKASHSEGSSTNAVGNYSHAQGRGTTAKNNESFAGGQYNLGTSDDTLFEFGLGEGVNGGTPRYGNGLEIYGGFSALHVKRPNWGAVAAPEMTNAIIAAFPTARVLVTREYGDANYLGGGSTAPYAHFIFTTSQNVGGANGTVVYINWDGTPIATDATFTHSTTVNPSRIQVADTGRYEIKAMIGATQTGSSRTTLMTHLRVNGTTISLRGRQRNYSRGSAYGDISVGMVTEIDLVANDYIEIATTVNDTDAVYTINSIAAESEFIIRKLA